jgi:hypothetical protein
MDAKNQSRRKGPGIKVELDATCCACGGKMIPHPRKSLTWICARSHWWNRKRKHAYLVMKVEEVPIPLEIPLSDKLKR